MAAETRPGGIPGAALAVSADPVGAGRVGRRALPFPPPAAFAVVAVLAEGGSAHWGLLEIRELKKSFGSLFVLDGIDLDVEEGEIQGVIGPNGAGKSTLFNIINGIYTTGSGTISFRGRSIANKPVYRITAMGIGRTFQVARVFDEMTVLQNMLVPTDRKSTRPNSRH